MYRIIGADGREYGPVSRELLLQWLAEGRVNAQTQALAEGGAQWKPLANFPEFAGAWTSPRAPLPLSSAYYGSAAVAKTNSLATTGLIMGVLSITAGCCCYGLPFNILGIIFSLIALSQIKNSQGMEQGRGLAIAGLVLSLLSIVLAILLVLIVGLASLPDILRELKKM